MGKSFSCLNRSHSAHAAALALWAEQSPGPAPSSPSPVCRVAASSVLPSTGQPGAFWSSTKPQPGGGEKQSPPNAASPAEHRLCTRMETPRTCAKSALASLRQIPSETSAERCQTDSSRFPGLVCWFVCLFSLEAAHRDIHPEPGPGLFMRGAAWPGQGPLPWAWRAQRIASLSLPPASGTRSGFHYTWAPSHAQALVP